MTQAVATSALDTAHFEMILALPGYLPASIPCRICDKPLGGHSMYFVKAARDLRSPLQCWHDPLHAWYCCPIHNIWCELPSKTVCGETLW